MEIRIDELDSDLLEMLRAYKLKRLVGREDPFKCCWKAGIRGGKEVEEGNDW